ncbi:MAG: glycine/sarcosine/betaine reductase complex component C subunit alpha [Bacillota bacterium]
MAGHNASQQVARLFHLMAEGLETGVAGRVKVGITLLGSELGIEEIIRGAELAQQRNPWIEVASIGPAATDLLHYPAESEQEQHQVMERLLDSGELQAAVTMHYNFPIGVATVGRVITPGRGREMFIATTTGAMDTDRVLAMVKSAVAGVAVAKACGIPEPSVGILNLDQARTAERALLALREKGYPLRLTSSIRADGGILMRGNDLLRGTPDVMVVDSLTGNVLMKVFSAYTTGGDYESLGFGYGPGVGEDYRRMVFILSRASGAPVVANAIRYAAEVARGNLMEVAREEFRLAERAGLKGVIQPEKAVGVKPEEVLPPPAKATTREIPGIDILELEDALRAVWKRGIYAESGMGCTGPVILVAPEDYQGAADALFAAGYLEPGFKEKGC